MAYVENDGRPLVAPPVAPSPDQDPVAAPLPALYPQLDRVSRSVFRQGSLSRQRIDRAVVLLALVAAIVAALVFLSQ